MVIPISNDLSDFQGSELESGYNEKNNTWEVIVKYHGDIIKIEKDINAEVEFLGDDYAIITIPADKIPLLYDYTEIEHIEKPKNLSFTLVQGLSRSCIPLVQSPEVYNLRGKGVLVAIIDSGIDYTHKDFRNEDGTSRILYFWDQTGNGKPPEGFKNGVEYTKQDLDNALLNENPFLIIPDLDFIGHGTAVAGVAAGNGRASGGINVGVAPESSIIAVRLGERGLKSFTRSTELMRALKYVIDKAQSINMPIAVNISYGTNNGSHDGNSLFETYINSVSMRWKTNICIATGNEGVAYHHFETKLKPYDFTVVEFFTSAGLQNFYITFWKNFVDSFTVELVLPNGKKTGEISYLDTKRVIKLDNVYIFVSYGQPTHYNDNQQIFFQIQTSTGYLSEGLWKINIRTGQIVDGNIEIWLPTVEQVTDDTAFSVPALDNTLTIPSTAEYAISVGGYDQRLNIFANFSGRGFTVGIVYIKPDIVAPAVNILTTAKGGGYDNFTGTSIAAPFVTGSCALMMQWGIVNKNDPFLYGQRIKAFLKLGATREENFEYPNTKWGYGALCLKNTMDYLKSFGKEG